MSIESFISLLSISQFLAKVFALVVLGLFSIFSIVLFIQVLSMSELLNHSLGSFVLKTLGAIMVITAISLFVIALVIL